VAAASNISNKVNSMFQGRLHTAQERFQEHIRKAYEENVASLTTRAWTPWDLWTSWMQYTTDFAQRSLLFWDTLRKRGNNFVAHEQAGEPPLLHFQYEIVLDARSFARPVNYALLRILPPEGVTTDLKRRPYIIIDPRAGHGPGIGGFKDDSQVGVALRDGHPVYFVVFHPKPEPGQTLLDVCAAEQKFMRKVRELHPDSSKPVIIGNCQGGWAAMMLAASDPEDTGPLVINGAPMSYWSGAWSEGEGDNPMRYTGGLLGGSWLSSLAADFGNGLFDGAFLVQNMENLNPANTFWEKYYHLFANIDTEQERFLEFERWWGGFYLLNKSEIEWIVQNLFVANKLWSGTKDSRGKRFDLRRIKSPIILFASLGDNITPPQQAFNWVADVYRSTEEIKASGQVIIGLMHENIGHLGIFVSGRVVKKEFTEIVSVLKSIEVLPPGLYAMHIVEKKGDGGNLEYDVEFVEHRLEDVVARLNRFKRFDEKAFVGVAEVSEFNQKAYELFAQPFVQSISNEYTAQLMRIFHPLRLQHWAFSDLNPWLAWLGPAADSVKAQRRRVDPQQPFCSYERFVSELISASLNYYRDIRDAICEATFFHTYGTVFTLLRDDIPESEANLEREPRAELEVRQAHASIATGGLAEAITRAECLLAVKDKPLPLQRFQLKQELINRYGEYLPELSPEQWRRIEGRQAIISEYEPEKAILTLPKLLADAKDRRCFLNLLDAVVDDPEVCQSINPTPEQRAMLTRIREVLSAEGESASASNSLGVALGPNTPSQRTHSRRDANLHLAPISRP
jgi:pimeloyl-ACP methyl ester carboxylesterase